MPFVLMNGMILSLGFVLATQLGTPQEPTAPAATTPAQAAPSFTQAFTVVEPNRLCVSPLIDGKLTDEEWDPLSTNSYFQWEPGKLHFAAKVGANEDAVFSVDLKANGWLIGDDNYEFRVSIKDGKPVLTARQLDATNVAGPVYRELPGIVLSSKFAASVDSTGTTIELSVIDPGWEIFDFSRSQKIGVRVDAVPSSEAPIEPFKPRVLTPVNLVNLRAAALPANIKWNLERNERAVTPGESKMMRFTFNAPKETKLAEIEIRSEGLAKDDTNKITTPFPAFDNKGRAIVDYVTGVAPAATTGYRIVRGAVKASDGIQALLEGSYFIAPLVDVELARKVYTGQTTDRGLPIAFYIGSSSQKIVKGDVTIGVPTGFRVLNGTDKQKFSITDKWGRIRKSFDLYIPGNSSGTYPITLTVNANGKTFPYTVYITFRG